MLCRLLLAMIALFAAAPAGAAWREASSDHFVIYSEDSEAALRKFATRLERYDAAMRLMYGVPDTDMGPASRLTVYAVGNLKAVQRLAPGKDNFTIGFYIPRAGGSVAFIPRRLSADASFLRAETVLLHEYAHHFLYQNHAAAYPAWFSEGFAEFNATARFEEDGSVGLGAPAEHRAYSLFAGDPLPLDKMMGQLPSRMNSHQREALYGRGWVLTHYLTFEPSRKGQLANYLTALNSGKGGVEAATAAFGDLAKLSRELDGYVKRQRLPFRRVEPNDSMIGKIAIRSLSPGEAAMMDVRIVSRRGVNLKQAMALVPEARRAAAPYPNDPVVQTWLAETEYDAGYHPEAEAAADRALAVDPKSIEALIYKGRVKMALAEDRKATDAATWKEVRRWLAAANRADPDDPEPLILFYSSFGAQGVKPTANAVVGLNQAYALAPQDNDLRFMAAYQFLVDRKAREARVALAPIAFNPHATEAGKLAAAMIEQIDAGNIDGALKAGEAPAKEKAAGT